MRLKRKYRISLFFICLVGIIVLSIYFVDKIRFNMFVNSYEEEFQLEINGELITPSNVEGKSFLFHSIEQKDKKVEVPNGSVVDFGKNYTLYNSSKEEIEGEITYLADGKYILEVVSGEYNYIYNLVVDNEFSVLIQDEFSYAAGYLVVDFIDVNETEEIEIIPSFETSEEFNVINNTVVVPINYNTTAGEYNVEFSSDNSSLKSNVVVKSYEFRESHFNVDEDVIGEASQDPDPKVLDSYEKANVNIGSELYYQESGFYAPSTGSTTGDFGDIRYINGDTTPTKIHYGVDYANVLNTEIYSTAKGEVTFVGFLPRYGNVIVVDHGGGITSHYFHLEETYVEVGDIVDNTTVIAGMGTTGYSTGVHLHFEIHINGVIVNPYFFLNYDLAFD